MALKCIRQQEWEKGTNELILKEMAVIFYDYPYMLVINIQFLKNVIRTGGLEETQSSLNP